MVIMVVLLNKVVETVQGLGYDRVAAHVWDRAGAVPTRFFAAEKSYNQLMSLE